MNLLLSGLGVLALKLRHTPEARSVVWVNRRHLKISREFKVKVLQVWEFPCGKDLRAQISSKRSRRWLNFFLIFLPIWRKSRLSKRISTRKPLTGKGKINENSSRNIIFFECVWVSFFFEAFSRFALQQSQFVYLLAAERIETTRLVAARIPSSSEEIWRQINYVKQVWNSFWRELWKGKPVESFVYLRPV